MSQMWKRGRISWITTRIPMEDWRAWPRPHSDVFSCKKSLQSDIYSRTNGRFSVLYSLRHYSQSRKWGLFDSVRCSELHMDFLPELFWVKGANSDPHVSFTCGTNTRVNMPEHKGYTLSWPASVFLSRMSCTGASPPQQRGGWCFLSV